jgi:serine/threonine protein kinase
MQALKRRETPAIGMTHAQALRTGTVLAGEYRIERVLGAGGFGITYLADEPALARRVTIKEYFPADVAHRDATSAAVPVSAGAEEDYRWGLDRFNAEARTLAKFDHPNIVRVHRTFEANNTGYMVLHFEEGQSLKAWLKGLGRAPRQAEIDRMLAPLLDALEAIHAADFLHRDIAPDNIMVRKDGSPVLIDFGSARGDIARHSRTLSALVKAGYSPYEQYAENGERQGPWTDIYALGATIYHAIAGRRPPDAPSRVVKDELVPAREAALAAYRPRFLAAIDRALALEISRRPASVAAWRGDLLAPEPAKPGWLKRALDRPAEPPKNDAGNSPADPHAVPPPPDAPGRKGVILDYIDGLQRKASPGAGEPTAPRPTAEAAPAAAAPAPGQSGGNTKTGPARSEDGPGLLTRLFGKGPPTQEPALAEPDPLPRPPSPAAPPPTPAPAPVAKARPPRPRRIRSRDGPSVRGIIVRGVIALCLVGVAAILYSRGPTIESRGAAVLTSQSGDLTEVGQLKGHAKGATGVAFSDDSRSIVTVGADATLRVWSASSGALQRTIELDNGPATALALSGRRAITGHGDGTAVLWEIDRAEKIAVLRRNEAGLASVAFAGEPSRLLTGSEDSTVVLWDAREKAAPGQVFEGHASAVQALAFSQARQIIASAGADRTVRLWSATTRDLVRTYRGHRDPVSTLAFTPDGRTLASGGADGTVRLWSTASSRLIRTLAGHGGRIAGLAFSPSGEVLATSGEDGAIRLWDHRRGKLTRTIAAGGGAITALAFSPDGRRVAGAGSDGAVRLWSAVVLPGASGGR